MIALIIARPLQNRWPGRPVRCAGLVPWILVPRDFPWSRGPVWPPSGPVPRPQAGLGRGSQDPESVVRGTRSVCWLGPVVPWSRLAVVWPRASSAAWLRCLGWVSQDPESVARWCRSVCPRGPVVPWSRLASLSLALSLCCLGSTLRYYGIMYYFYIPTYPFKL